MAVPHRQPDPLPDRYITPAEYLAFERASEEKHEYYDGRIYAMSGARRNHELIVWNIASLLHAQFRGRSCMAFVGNMRAKVSATGLYTYPDVAALCGEPTFEDETLDTLFDPSVVVEVLSDSTQRYDRGVKFAHYQNVASLREYVLVAQYDMHVERHVRTEAGWERTDLDLPDDVLELASVGCTLRLGDLYERVVFPSRPPGPRRVREGSDAPEPAPA